MEKRTLGDCLLSTSRVSRFFAKLPLAFAEVSTKERASVVGKSVSTEIKQIPTRTSSSGIDVSHTPVAEKSNSPIERRSKRDAPPWGGRGEKGAGGTWCKSVSRDRGNEERERETIDRAQRERDRERERERETQECGARSGGERTGG